MVGDEKQIDLVWPKCVVQETSYGTWKNKSVVDMLYSGIKMTLIYDETNTCTVKETITS